MQTEAMSRELAEKDAHIAKLDEELRQLREQNRSQQVRATYSNHNANTKIRGTVLRRLEKQPLLAAEFL